MFRNTTILAALFAFLIQFGFAIAADCSDQKVMRLAQNGETVNAIAQKCDMTRSKVRDIIESIDDEPDQKPDLGLPVGSPVGQCGCWGFADPNGQVPHPRCKSGYAHPEMCQTMCPMGGFAWRGVCS